MTTTVTTDIPEERSLFHSIFHQRIPDSLKPTAFQALSWSHQAFRGIEPIRKRLLQPLKIANDYVARKDRADRRPNIRSFPVHLVIETHTKCDLHCPMCFRQQYTKEQIRQANGMEMPKEKFLRLAEETFPYARIANIAWAGETLLLSYLDEALETLDKHQTKLEMNTSMTLMGENGNMEKILPRLGFIRASIDAVEKESYERIRVGATFEKVMANLRRFGEARRSMKQPPVFGINVTIQRDNVHQLADLVRLAADVGAGFLNGQYIVVLGPSTRHLSIIRQPQLYARHIEEARRVGEDLGVQVLIPPAGRPTGDLDSIPTNGRPSCFEEIMGEDCSYLWTHVIIGIRGYAFACCLPQKPQYPGTVFDGFWKLWSGPEAERIRLHRHTPSGHAACRKCNLMELVSNPETYNCEAYHEEKDDDVVSQRWNRNWPAVV